MTEEQKKLIQARHRLEEQRERKTERDTMTGGETAKNVVKCPMICPNEIQFDTRP